MKINRGVYVEESFVKHLVVECSGVLQSMMTHETLVNFIYKMCEKFDLHIVKEYDHQFSPYGSTIVFVLEESHIALHSWPEHGYIHCDIVTCSPEHLSAMSMKKFTQATLRPRSVNIMRLKY